MAVYHFYATYQTVIVDGLITIENEVKTGEDYKIFKEAISDKFFGGVAAKYIIVKSMSILNK